MALLKRKKNADQTQAAPQQDANGAVMEEIDAEEVMRKYDKESNTRIWEGVPKIIVTTFMVAFSVYCLLMTLLSTEQAEARLARFLAFVVVIGFMMYPARKTNHKVNHIPWYDIVLAALGFATEPPVPAERLLAAVTKDKKSEGDTIRLVLPTAVGACEVRTMTFDELSRLVRSV